MIKKYLEIAVVALLVVAIANHVPAAAKLINPAPAK